MIQGLANFVLTYWCWSDFAPGSSRQTKNTHGTLTYVNRFALRPKLHVYPCGTFGIDRDEWWRLTWLETRMSVPKRRSNCWLLTLLVLHGTMRMLWKCVMRRKQKEEKEQRWAASRKPLPHIITLDYTLQWGPNAARCLQSRKTGLKGAFKSNFDWLNWPYPSLCSSCQSRDVTNTYDLFKTWSTWRADITHIHVCSGSSQRRHQELQGSLVEQNILLLLLNWIKGRFYFKFSMIFFPAAPASTWKIYEKKNTSLFKHEWALQLYRIYLEKNSNMRGLKKCSGNCTCFFLPSFTWTSTSKELEKKKNGDGNEQCSRQDLYPGHCC